MRLARIPTALLPVFALLAGCPEGEQVTSIGGPASCDEAKQALADGIQTGDELVLAFDCLNVDGAYASLEPVVYALNGTQAPDGERLLDLWVSAINQALTQGAGPGITVALTPDDVADVVGQLAGFMVSGAPQVALDLTAEAIDQDVVADTLYWAHWFGQGAAAMKGATAGPSLAQWLSAAQDLLCHGWSGEGPCRSNLQLALQGMAAFAQPTPWNPDDPANDDLQQTLDYMLYARGNVSVATQAHEGLARALAELATKRPLPGAAGTRSVLSFLLQDVVPELYGDDPSTNYVYEGYGSRNPQESALYAIMLTLADPDVQAAQHASGDQIFTLVNKYFPINAGVTGKFEPYHSDVCEPPSVATETFGVANNGLDQLLRLLAASDVDWDQTPEACQGIFRLGLPLISPFLDLSGEKSIGGLILEIFPQLPIEVIRVVVQILNVPQVVDLSNRLCGLNLQYDDTEALEAAVNWDETMAMTLPLLDAVNEANAMPILVDTLSALWSSPAVCELGPTARILLGPDAPEGSATPGLNLLPQPDAAPGTTPHDQITAPLLATAVDLGRHAEVLLGPVEWALTHGEADLVKLLLSVGKMAHAKDTALTRIGLLQSELSQLNLGEGPVDLSPGAAALDDRDLAFALLSTLAAPEVIDSLVYGGAQAPPLLTQVSTQITDGTFTDYLDILGALLGELDAELAADDSTDDTTGLTLME